MAIDFFGNSYSALDLYRFREQNMKKVVKKAVRIVATNGWDVGKSALLKEFQKYYDNNTSYVSNFCSVYKDAIKQKKDVVEHVRQYIQDNKNKLRGFLKRLQGAYESSTGAILDKIRNKIKTTNIPDFGESNIEFLNTLKKDHPLEHDLLVLLLIKYKKYSKYEAFAIATCIKRAPEKCQNLNLDQWVKVIENYKNSYDTFMNKRSIYKFPEPNRETPQRLKNLFNTRIHKDITGRIKPGLFDKKLTKDGLLTTVINICKCWWNYPVFMPDRIYKYMNKELYFFRSLVLDLYDYLKLPKPTTPILYQTY